MEKNILSLYDDENFYDYDENGNKIDLDLNLLLNNNKNIIAEKYLFESVSLVKNLKIDYENLNVFDFFQKNIEQIKIDGDFFKSYKIEEAGILYNALFKLKCNEYQLIFEAFSYEMDYNTLFDYMLKNEIK